jgi:hypothetical protein
MLHERGHWPEHKVTGMRVISKAQRRQQVTCFGDTPFHILVEKVKFTLLSTEPQPVQRASAVSS